jgi:hypothetical protein
VRVSIAAAATALASVIAAGCAFVPPLDDATGTSDSPVLVADIVDRLKCELAFAFADKLDRRNSQFIWLQDWTVKADLTLQANQQGGISPSGTYTTYQRSAANTAAGPAAFGGTTPGLVQQFFTFSANANLGAQAVRTETLSFSLSLKELNSQRIADRSILACAPTGEPGLVGNLGLREWIDSALYPAVRRDLLAGKHPAPGTGAKPSSPQIVGKPAPITGAAAFTLLEKAKTPKNVEDMRAAVNKAVHAELDASNSFESARMAWKDIEAKLDTAKRLEAGYGPISTPETLVDLRRQRQAFDQLWEAARQVRQCTLRQLCGSEYGSCRGFSGPGAEGSDGPNDNDCKATAKCLDPRNISTTSGARGSRACAEAARDGGDKDEEHYADWLLSAQNAAEQASQYATNAKNLADYPQKLLAATPVAPDPPIDSLGHAVQFVLAYGAGVTPNWTLLAWKGPGMNAPMIAASGTRTHLLQLALGPSTPSARSSGELNRIIQNQTIFLSRP